MGRAERTAGLRGEPKGRSKQGGITALQVGLRGYVLWGFTAAKVGEKDKKTQTMEFRLNKICCIEKNKEDSFS